MAEINKDNASMDFPLQIARQYGAPLDKDSVFYSIADAESYAKDSPLSYPGQVIGVVDTAANTVEIYKITIGGDLVAVGSDSIYPGTETPLMDGEGTAGTSKNYARSDHVHPENTNKADVSALPTVFSVTIPVDRWIDSIATLTISDNEVIGRLKSTSSVIFIPKDNSASMVISSNVTLQGSSAQLAFTCSTRPTSNIIGDIAVISF